MIGRTIAHYKIIEKLGGGGMGVVYKAEDRKLGRMVALKMLPEELLSDAEALDRFQREARAASALDHPNICTIYDIGEHEGQPFIVMQFLEGSTLKHRVEARPMTVDEVVDLGIQIADALEQAHTRGVVHRDIKPANIFITKSGQAKLLDFGLAKAAPPNPSEASGAPTVSPALELTKTGIAVGTVAYMSPEQALAKVVDSRTDLFSLGVVLYNMATGQLPFRGESSIAILNEVLNKTPAPIRKLNPGLPSRLQEIVDKALEKDRALRHQTASDIRVDLQRLKRELDSAKAFPVVHAAHPPSAVKKRKVVIAGAVLAMTVAAVALVALLSPTSRERDAGGPLVATFARITSDPGEEFYPSLSPDGQWVTYVSSATGNLDIYHRSVGGENPINLTKDSSGIDTQPAFSPDGQFIAFHSRRQGVPGIFVMGRTGESVRRLTNAGFNPAWSPDGKHIVFGSESATQTTNRSTSAASLHVVEVSTGQVRELLKADGIQPHWSPHGHRVAFWGIHKGGQRDIWTVPAQGGEPVPVTDDVPADWNPVWSPDGTFLYFSSERGGGMNLWRLPINEVSGKVLGPAEPVTSGAAGSNHHVSIARDVKRIAYVDRMRYSNIHSITFDAVTGKSPGNPQAVTRGTNAVWWLDISPDGEWLTYSTETSPQDLFILRKDGTGRLRLTNDMFRDRRPRWSPDGKRVLFYSDRGGGYDVWSINRDGGELRQHTKSDKTAIHAVWNHDGSRAAFLDSTGGATYLIDPNKNWDQQATETLPRLQSGAMFAPTSWSPDGKWLGGHHYPRSGGGIVVYSMESREFRDLTATGGWPVWLKDGRRILFRSVADRAGIFLLDINTKKVVEVIAGAADSIADFTISSDNRTIYFVLNDNQADIVLMNIQ